MSQEKSTGTLLNDQLAKPGFGDDDFTPTAGGMSLRDWYAGMALQGMIGAYEITGELLPASDAEEFAQDAYVMADAMIAARGQ